MIRDLIHAAGGWPRFIAGGIVGTLYMASILYGVPLIAVALGVTP